MKCQMLKADPIIPLSEDRPYHNDLAQYGQKKKEEYEASAQTHLSLLEECIKQSRQQ